MACPPVVLLGMLTKIPVAGPAWLVLHYMEGLRRLGFPAEEALVELDRLVELGARDVDPAWGSVRV